MSATEESTPNTPPRSRLSERRVLGSMIRDNAVIGDVLQIVERPGFFYLDAHQRIFKAIVAIYQTGRPVDAGLLAEELARRGDLEDAGGFTYIDSLLESSPTAANAEHYARIVRDKALARSLISACSETIRDVEDGSRPADELLDAAERRVMEIAMAGVTGQAVTLEQAVSEACDRIDARAEGRAGAGVPTGFADLDHLSTGLQDSELVLVAARPSVGKTSFALSLLRNITVDQRLPTFFVSLEQSRVELAERLLSAQAGVDGHHLRRGVLSRDEQTRLNQARDVLRGAVMFIDDTPVQGVLRIAANARRLKLRHEIRMVCIDYLQLIEPDNRRDPRHEQVAQIGRRLKGLARELRIPVVALAQVNRAPEARADKKPRLSDLRESGTLEADADVVMILHRPEKGEPGYADDLVDLSVAKQRNGPIGDIVLKFAKEYTRFENHVIRTPFES